jgi:hypothetical protein
MGELVRPSLLCDPGPDIASKTASLHEVVDADAGSVVPRKILAHRNKVRAVLFFLRISWPRRGVWAIQTEKYVYQLAPVLPAF